MQIIEPIATMVLFKIKTKSDFMSDLSDQLTDCKPKGPFNFVSRGLKMNNILFILNFEVHRFHLPITTVLTLIRRSNI